MTITYLMSNGDLVTASIDTDSISFCGKAEILKSITNVEATDRRILKAIVFDKLGKCWLEYSRNNIFFG
jgi:hypothetical protein